MKKRILLMTLMLALFVCVFAVSVNAANDLKPQTSDAYGELSFFDESVTVGRTNTKYGFTPYIDAEGTTYARVVVGDGTTFYTFPTAYVLSEGTIYGEGQINNYVRDLTSLNSAMQAATGTNPNWTDDNIYRIELPHSVTRLNGGSQQAFQGYDNVIEIRLQPNSHIKDQNKTLIFWKCFNLEVIHNLDSFTFRKGCVSGAFQECAKLTNLTIGYSPEVTELGTNVFNGCTALQSVNIKEAFPNLTSIGNYSFYQCTNLVSTSSEDGFVSFPSTLTTIGQQGFYQCRAISIVSFPTTLTYLGPQCFRDCTALKLIDFNGNLNNVDFNNNGVFRGCSALKAASLPKNTTKLYNGMFTDCGELEVVYLPQALQEINGNKYGDGAFDDCTKLYFTSTEFDVKDFMTDGAYDAAKFAQNKPVKEEIYFFPSSLNKMGNTQNSPTFLFCTSLNSVLVFPTTFTGGLSSDGDLLNIGTKQSPKKVVFLGDMSTFYAQTQNSRQNYITFYFMNASDLSPADVGYKNGYASADATEGYMVFCHGENAGYYQIKRSTTYSEKMTDKALHLMNPKATQTTFAATCIKNAIETQYCFCTVKIYEGEVAGSATGVHIYADDHDCTTSDKCTSDPECTAATEALSHDILETLVYVSFTSKGTYNYLCQNDGCTVVDIVDEEKNAIVSPKGYSISDSGTGINGGYNVDVEALRLYENVNGKITFGIAIANPERFESGASFFNNENKLNTQKGVQIEMTSRQYGAFDCSINGFAPEHADTLKLVITSYIIDENGEVFFFQHENNYDIEVEIGEQIFNYVTLNIAKNKTPVTNTPDAVLPTNED